MKKIISSILLILTVVNSYSQKVILNESFKGQKFTKTMLCHSEKNKHDNVPVASFSFSKIGQNDESSLRVSIKRTGDKKNVKLILKNIELSKNKTYQVSFLTKSRTGDGKIIASIFNNPAEKKYITLFRKNFNFEKSYNKWHKEQFKFKATRKNNKGETVDLKNITFVLNFSGLSRGIYLIDDVIIKQID